MKFEGNTYQKREVDILVKKLKKDGEVEKVKNILRTATAHWVHNISFINQLLVICEDIDEVRQIFKSIKERNTTPISKTYLILIGLFENAGMIDDIWEVYRYMKWKEKEYLTEVYSCFLITFSKNNHLDKAMRVYQRMRQKEIGIKVVVLCVFINAYAAANKLYLVKKLFKDFPIVEENYFVCVAKINILSKAKSIHSVWEIFEEMQKKKIVGDELFYSKLIDTFKQAGDPDKVLTILQEMKNTGIVPDYLTTSSVISTFRSANRQQEIIELLNPAELHVKSLPIYCDALRKCKKYNECIQWCDFALESLTDASDKEYVWVVRFHCYLFTNKKKYFADAKVDIITESSKQYVRFLTVKIFGQAYLPKEVNHFKKILLKALTEDRNSSSKKDIENALLIIS